MPETFCKVGLQEAGNLSAIREHKAQGQMSSRTHIVTLTNWFSAVFLIVLHTKGGVFIVSFFAFPWTNSLSKCVVQLKGSKKETRRSIALTLNSTQALFNYT